ncbi:MAG: hypothetical protein JRI34_12055 [Deltaproteobacteria bacterium]|nr:hypothetical protein [Deltaproteobacteria bacterium]
MFKVGDQIFYVNSKQEIFPGRILDIKKRVKISYNHFTGKKTLWVSPNNIQPLDTTRCAHNEECGWCADTGNCIYS